MKKSSGGEVTQLPAGAERWLGRRIGAYQLVALIGRGGMGAVYLARRGRRVRAEVAIKLIDRRHGSDGLLKRFRAERQILATLEHPHIARLIDGGGTGRESVLVMEHVSGEPSMESCDAPRLGVDGVSGLLTVCDAVQFAHQRLVVHRDLKPDNILVTATAA